MFRNLSKLKSVITLAEHPNTLNEELLLPENGNGKISENVYSRFRMPSRALHLLEAIIRKTGYEDVQSIIPAYHGKGGKFSHDNINRLINSDLVLLSSITPTAPQTAKLISKIKRENPDVLIGVGGYDPTFRPDYWFSAGVDFIAVGEGENIIREIMDSYASGRDLSSVKGVRYMENGVPKFTGFREPMSPKELTNQPHPYLDKTTKQMSRINTIETSRGCIFDCNFCGIAEFYKQKKYRIKSIDYIIEELELGKDIGKAIFWTADNSFANMKYGIDLFTTVGKSSLSKPGIIQATIDIARNPQALKALKSAGVEVICIGLESFNEKGREFLEKHYTPNQVLEWLEIINNEGLNVHAMMMPGGDYDTLETMKQELDIIRRPELGIITAQFCPPGPLPGTRLRAFMIKQGRLLRAENQERWGLYDGHYVLTRHPIIPSDKFQIGINDMYRGFYTDTRANEVRSSNLSSAVKLIYSCIEKGVINAIKSVQMNEYIEFLKGIN
jgi:radical SAM superfamily enzyme YgiQ (UPF0313 family)